MNQVLSPLHTSEPKTQRQTFALVTQTPAFDCVSIQILFRDPMRAIFQGAAGVVVSVVLGFVLSTRADEPRPQSSAPRPLEKAVLAPALKAAAERDGIAFLKPTVLSGPPATGDAILAWVGTTRGAQSQQWLIQFKRGSSTAAERKAHRVPDRKKYLSWGSVVTFQSEVEALDLWIAGPVDGSSRASRGDTPPQIASTQRSRVFVPGEYLRLGLDESARVDLYVTRRITEILKEDPQFSTGHIYSLEKPIKPENIAWAKPVAEKIGYTPEIERAWMGGYVALEAYYNLANTVPALRKIAEVAVEKPPVWKLAKQAFGTNFMTYLGGGATQEIDAGAAGMLPVAQSSLEVPFSFSLGKDPIVGGVMVVTAPNPPLDVSAGILALLAYHPIDKSRAIEVILIGASSAESAEKAESAKTRMSKANVR